MKFKNWVLIGTILVLSGLTIVLTSTGLLKSQVQEVGGLAVAQSPIKWNHLRDAASGDNVASGIGAFSPYLYTGIDFVRARGDSIYGLDVDITRMPAILGNKTPSDSYGNPTDAIPSWSLLGIFDGTNWNRVLSSTHGDNLTTTRGLNVAGFNYLFDGTNWDRWLLSTHGDNLTTATGANVAGFQYGFDGTNWDRVLLSTHGDGLTTASGQNVAGFLYQFNGTNWERVRGNLDITVLSSAVRSSTTNSSDFINQNGRGLKVVFNITAVPGTDTVTLSIEGKDPLSGVYYTIFSGAAESSIGTKVYTIYPGIPIVENVSANDILPRTWRVKVTHSAGTNFTYSVGASVIQ
ncbi:MAG: hypothetical protein K6T87_15930 [Roseiflexus sp.]|uniref:hypothetical protein n=1 Tax=Roseiflexus sp. TaxID=2562120 RepID=UPI0025DD166C|nr:hypothetical protein [Roseiflexus sp.]MCL6542045.1 hypothetical protein [Roseiflexus sp.]